MAFKKFCSHCGCNRLIDCTERYCDVHKKRDKAESDKQYDKHQRNKESKAFTIQQHGKGSGSRYLSGIKE